MSSVSKAYLQLIADALLISVSGTDLKLGCAGTDSIQLLLAGTRRFRFFTGGYFLRENVQDALTATGTTRADALAVTGELVRVGTTAANTGIVLPAGTIGMTILVSNGGASTLTVYAAGSDTIDAVAGTTGVAIATVRARLFAFTATNKWVSVYGA